MSNRPSQGLLFPRGVINKELTVESFEVAKNITVTGDATFAVVEVAGINGANPYSPNLSLTCLTNWAPTGSFCNKILPDYKGVMFKHSNNNGATWTWTNATSVGVLVVDTGSLQNIQQIEYYQMFSDAKYSHITMFVHPEQGETAPSSLDIGWVGAHPEVYVGAGNNNFEGYPNTVYNPFIIDNLSLSSRYLKFEARNDKSFGGSNYIEIGGIKVFTPQQQVNSNEYILEVRESRILDGADVDSWDNMPASTWDNIVN